MNRLATSRPGRVVLHILASIQDHAWKFHAAGIAREFAHHLKGNTP